MRGHVNVKLKIFSTVTNANMDTSDCQSSKGPSGCCGRSDRHKKVSLGVCSFYIGIEDTRGFKFSHWQRREIKKILGLRLEN
jgi:hypothetical protein